MATLEQVVASLDELKAFVVEVDAAVESLHDLIAQLQSSQGFDPAVGDALVAKVAEIRAAVSKVSSDD